MTKAATMNSIKIPLTATQTRSQRPWWTKKQLMQKVKTVTQTSPFKMLLLRLLMSLPVDQLLQQVRIFLM